MSWEEALYYKGWYEAKQAIKTHGKGFFSLKDFCFDKQWEFCIDQSQYKTLCKSRRAGGTAALAASFLHKGSNTKNANLAYITLDRGTAERIIWPELQRISNEKRLGLEFKEQKLIVEFPDTASRLYLASGKDKKEINKLRGKPYHLVAIDEAQSFKDSLLKELINDILEASFIDYGGMLCLVGTPNAACSGYFYEATKSKQYKHFFWTMKDNPWIERKRGIPIADIFRKHLEDKGITENDPTFQREWLGKWVRDENALVYKYDPERNSYADLPAGYDWSYVIGVDLGYDDDDAIVVWAFSQKAPVIYQVEEYRQNGLTVSALAKIIQEIIEKVGIKNVYKIVVDTGGIGKKVHEEFAQRWNIQCFPAQKSEKLHYISLFNDDLKRNRIYLKKGGQYEEEINLLQWDSDAIGRLEDPALDNHLCDAGLYAYRECLHFLHKPEIEPIRKTEKQATKEWADTIMERTLERYERHNNSQASKNWWEKI